jgi:hypothetical protein
MKYRSSIGVLALSAIIASRCMAQTTRVKNVIVFMGRRHRRIKSQRSKHLRIQPTASPLYPERTWSRAVRHVYGDTIGDRRRSWRYCDCNGCKDKQWSSLGVVFGH